MRHRVAGRKLNRSTSHRLAMLGNMVASLLEHEAIRTTVPKAKEARRMAERIITLGKRGGLSNIRLASRTVHDRNVLQKVFGALPERYADRAGGYTRIIRLGQRPGDAAEMALLELVDRPQAQEKPQKKAKPEEPEKKAKAAEAEEKPAEKKAEAKAETTKREKPAKKAKGAPSEKSAAAKSTAPKAKKASPAPAKKSKSKKSEE